MKRVLVCAALMLWSAVASAIIYKWVDADGKVHYGDRPPDGVKAVIVDNLGPHVARAAPAPAGPAPANAPARTGPAGANPDQPTSAEKQAVDADVAATKEKQCAEAQARYKQLIEGRRLYKTGESGERQYLTAEEIDSERLNAKHDVDSVCSGSQ